MGDRVGQSHSLLVWSSNPIGSHGPDLYSCFKRTVSESASRAPNLASYLPSLCFDYLTTNKQPLWEWLEQAMIVVLLRCTFVLQTNASIDFNITRHFGRSCWTCMFIALVWIRTLYFHQKVEISVQEKVLDTDKMLIICHWTHSST